MSHKISESLFTYILHLREIGHFQELTHFPKQQKKRLLLGIKLFLPLMGVMGEFMTFNPVYGQTLNPPVAQVVQSPSVRELPANGTVNRNDFSTNKQLKTDSTTLYQQALNRMDLQDYRGAITDFNQVLKIENNNPYAYLSRGIGYFLLNEYQAAKVDFDKALAIIPNIAYAHCFRGMTRYLLEDKEGALTDLQRASILFEQQGKIETVQKANEAIKKIQEELNSQYKKQLFIVMHLHRKTV
ncbi:MAG: hypothetical protein AB3A66_05035 [Nodularia sp. CChRGM 3473]